MDFGTIYGNCWLADFVGSLFKGAFVGAAMKSNLRLVDFKIPSNAESTATFHKFLVF